MFNSASIIIVNIRVSLNINNFLFLSEVYIFGRKFYQVVEISKMKSTYLVYTIVLFLIVAGQGWSANFDKGLDAFDNEIYDIALQEWVVLAEQGDASAQSNLGVMYMEGKGVPQDDKEALKWWTLAAQQGDKSAQFNLGNMYRLGKGVLQDYKVAVDWYLLSASQKFSKAQFNLGTMFDSGTGVLQDYKIAVSWYILASEQGHPQAQYNLGLKYGMGKGISQDHLYAYMWATISAQNGFKKSLKLRDLAAKQITPSQIIKAKDLVRLCTKKAYKGCEKL